MLVVYSGNDCKVIMNRRRGANKSSIMDKEGQKYQRFMIMITNLTCIFCATFNLVYIFVNQSSLKVLVDFESQNWLIYFLKRMGGWQLLLAKMVPINLIMTTRLIKFLQAKRLNNIWRRILKRDVSNDKIGKLNPGDVFNPDSNDDLGMVDYVFFDKTGTLTEEVLTVSKVYVGTYCFKESFPFTREEDQMTTEDTRDQGPNDDESSYRERT